MNEAAFSKAFKKAVEKTGAMAIRLETSHTCPGLPDYLIICPYGSMSFAELKVAPNKLELTQVALFNALDKLHATPWVFTRLPDGKVSRSLGGMSEGVLFSNLQEAVAYYGTN